MVSYAPGPGDSIVSGAVAATEDLTRIQGIIAGCGEAAMLVLLHIQNGLPTTPQELYNVILQMVAARETVGVYWYAGQSSPANLEWLAGQYNTQIQSLDWQTAVSQYAGVRPIVVGVATAGAGFGGPDLGVNGHYVTIVGRTGQGNLIVSDPNTPESQAGKFVVYSPQQFAAATPFWAGVPSTAPSGGPPIPGLGGILTLPQNLINFFNNWGNGPIRLLKLVLGATIIVGTLFLALFGEVIKGIFGIGAQGVKTAAIGKIAKATAAIIP